MSFSKSSFVKHTVGDRLSQKQFCCDSIVHVSYGSHSYLFVVCSYGVC